MSQEAFWSTRYQNAGDEYLFGTEPNHFLARRADLFAQGHNALLVADGEGRNSVWMAEQGLEVTAVEFSSVAVAKAKKLAAGRNCSVEFVVADMLADHWPPTTFIDRFDWVVGIFIQFANPEQRLRQFAALKRATRPGGAVILQGYTPKQLDYKTGGPSAAENLYTASLLREAFSDWQIEELVDYEDEINEGLGHKGRSALIGLVARKPLGGGDKAMLRD